MPGKALVLDANILIRAVLGKRVRRVLETHAETVFFLIPESAYREAEVHLAAIVTRRRADPEKALAMLRAVVALGDVVDPDLYRAGEIESRRRLAARDPADWPVLATALIFDCPIWTEDADFFGCGVATWTTDRVELFFENDAQR